MNDIRAAIEGDAVFNLEHLALIAVDGNDAQDFLQGQLTNDLCVVTASRAQQSAWCSPKGRVLTCLLVFRHGQRLMLQLPRSLVDQTVKRLRMFVLPAIFLAPRLIAINRFELERVNVDQGVEFGHDPIIILLRRVLYK